MLQLSSAGENFIYILLVVVMLHERSYVKVGIIRLDSGWVLNNIVDNNVNLMV